jgi:hypothetical protein
MAKKKGLDNVIIKKPSKIEEEDFINKAPDGQKPARYKRGNKVQITMTIDEAVLDQADGIAKELGLSRSALMSVALSQIAKFGLKLGGNQP